MKQLLTTFVLALLLVLPAWALAATPVNVNTANAAVIAKSLDGIGLTKAQAIVDWREAHGSFKQVDDLGHVKGIGKATIERNRSAIQLADSAAAVKATPAKRADLAPEDAVAD
ncbi:MAG: ComEA family DNA-binding protein [Rhodanobacter sp.]